VRRKEQKYKKVKIHAIGNKLKCIIQITETISGGTGEAASA